MEGHYDLVARRFGRNGTWYWGHVCVIVFDWVSYMGISTLYGISVMIGKVHGSFEAIELSYANLLKKISKLCVWSDPSVVPRAVMRQSLIEIAFNEIKRMSSAAIYSYDQLHETMCVM